MGLDQLVRLLSEVAKEIIPIAIVAVLIYAALFIRQLIVMLKTTDETMKKAQTTFDIFNKVLEKLYKPLNTINELSETVDNVHEASKQAVMSSLKVILSNINVIKDWVIQQVKKDKGEEKKTEPAEKKTEEPEENIEENSN